MLTPKCRTWLLLIAVLLCSHIHAHDLASQATYLGNEGVMVARAETKVLFDAFYADSYGQYALVPESISELLMAGAPPYDGIDALFVSHVHGDHFSAEPAIAYLRAQPQVLLFGPAQVRKAMLESGLADSDPVLQRVRSFDLKPDDDPIRLDVEGFLIEAAAIPHAGGQPMAHISNLAWRVTLDAHTTVLHLGDAGDVIANFQRHASFFDQVQSHAAFVPFWLYLSEAGKIILEQMLNAEHTIGVHVPASAIGHGEKTRSDLGGDAFTDPGETRSIPNGD